ncbi:hypothetical protein WME73_06110 [Sorangium sp. So ce302]|uniref:hypothetical protein n=1 Tax=Sorangium sp. So ce302 TaxID=3133297 RepID=UPI003F61633A
MLNLHKLVRDALLDDATHSPTLRARLERDGARAFRYFDRILRSREAYARVGLDLTEFSSLLPFDISSLSTLLLVCLAMQRDGYLRQRAVSALAVRVEAISLAGVANRTRSPSFHNMSWNLFFGCSQTIAARRSDSWHCVSIVGARTPIASRSNASTATPMCASTLGATSASSIGASTTATARSRFSRAPPAKPRNSSAPSRYCQSSAANRIDLSSRRS